MNKSIEPENPPVRVTMADVRRWEFAAERQKVVDDYCAEIVKDVVAGLEPHIKEMEQKIYRAIERIQQCKSNLL